MTRAIVSWLLFWWARLVGRDDRVVFTDPARVVHVRAWGRRGRTYLRGEAIPHLRGHSTYDVETVEGDVWVNCGKGKIMSWSVKPIMGAVVRLDGSFTVRGRTR